MLHVTEPNSQLLWSHFSELKEHIQRCCSYQLWSAHTWPCGPFWGPSTVDFKGWMAPGCSYWHRREAGTGLWKGGRKKETSGFPYFSFGSHHLIIWSSQGGTSGKTPRRSELDVTQLRPAGSCGNPASASASGWCYAEGLGAIGPAAANPSLDGFHSQTHDLFNRQHHVQAVCGHPRGSGPAPLSCIGEKAESTEEYCW